MAVFGARNIWKKIENYKIGENYYKIFTKNVFVKII